MNLNKRVNLRLPPPKELFFKSTKALGLLVGAFTTISNNVIPWLAYFAGKTNEFATYLGSRYPFPPDPVNMFNSAWLQEGVANGLKFAHIPFTNELGMIPVIFGFIAGPALIGLSLIAKTKFPQKEKK